MQTDEEAIRQLVSTWLTATRAGDLETVLGLMTEDAVFLVGGQPPMIGKESYAAKARAQADHGSPQIDGTSDIKEIEVVGDRAFLWTELTVTVTPAGGVPLTRTGHTLSVLRKEDGRWLLARDANLLVPVRASEGAAPTEEAPAG